MQCAVRRHTQIDLYKFHELSFLKTVEFCPKIESKGKTQPLENLRVSWLLLTHLGGFYIPVCIAAAYIAVSCI